MGKTFHYFDDELEIDFETDDERSHELREKRRQAKKERERVRRLPEQLEFDFVKGHN